jgi:hypothetical protein
MTWNSVGEFVEKFGVVIAALLAAGGYMWRLKAERRKTTRRVLYCLLEIRTAAIRQFMNNPNMDKAARTFIGIGETKVKRKGFYELKGEMFRLPEEYVRDYETAIQELSKDRPLLASELRGTGNFHIVMESMRNTFTDACSLFRQESNMNLTDSKLMQELAEKWGENVEKNIQGLDKRILLVAKAAGLVRQTKRLLKRQTIQNYMKQNLALFLKNVNESKEFKDRVLSELKAAENQK